MGSLRNPIGPLPSSIYWRRRAVALALIGLLVLLVVWVFSLGGEDSTSEEQGKGGGGSGPESTITPGPSDSGPAISERPGGREEADDGGSDGSGDSGGSDSSGASGGSGGSDDEAGSGGGAAGGTAGGSGWESGDGGGSGSGSGGGAPADAALPECGASDVKVTLRSVKKEYGAGEKPRLELTAENTSDSACVMDLGKATVVTVTDSDDKKFWASDDCPPNSGSGPYRVRVPANDESSHTFEWYRTSSSERCEASSRTQAKPGKYKAEAEVKGLKPARTSFTLTED